MSPPSRPALLAAIGPPQRSLSDRRQPRPVEIQGQYGPLPCRDAWLSGHMSSNGGRSAGASKRHLDADHPHSAPFCGVVRNAWANADDQGDS